MAVAESPYWLGYSSDSWGTSWGYDSGGEPVPVEDTRRPRTNPNLKLRRIVDVTKKLVGSADSDSSGQLQGVVVNAIVIPAISVTRKLRGGVDSDASGRYSRRVSHKRRFYGGNDRLSTGTVRGCSGMVCRVARAEDADGSGSFVTHAGSVGRIAATITEDVSGTFDDVTVVRNPSDEELAILVLDMFTSNQYKALHSGRRPPSQSI